MLAWPQRQRVEEETDRPQRLHDEHRVRKKAIMNRGLGERPGSARPSFAGDDGEAHGDGARLNVAIVCREYAGETRAMRAALPTRQEILRRIGIAGAVVNWDICARQPM
ncbi:hypothetical protein B2G74_17500 [Burkholderia sp. A27]|jgi:hypothetical protein|nr:hypothetical protein B2G74_17500 [Burkholderia sp. A27]